MKAIQCYAGYPFAEAFEIQYEVKRDENGKTLYETKRGSKDFRRDRDGNKIPILDKSQPQKNKDGQIRKKKARRSGQLPWGFVVKDTGKRKEWVERKKKVKYAACQRRIGGKFKRETVWIREDQLQSHPCLEVVFVDIGQGDGCYLITPNPDNPKDPKNRKRYVIDAGQEGNMSHFLNWRHGYKEFEFDGAVISHPDADHYRGFENLFERSNFKFKTVYTNGLMECLVDDEEKARFKAAKAAKEDPLPPEPTGLGPVEKFDGVSYVTDLVTNLAELKTFLRKTKRWASKSIDRKGTTAKKKTGKQFPTMLNEAVEGWKRLYEGRDDEREEKQETMGDYKMLSVEDGWLPGYEPKDPDNNPRELTIQVLGPVIERIPGKNRGKPMLQYLDRNVGKAKNGHSVVLRLQFGNVSMMLGGDLNIPSEHLLLTHHTGMDSPPDVDHQAAFVAAARSVFQVDIAKSCHHGSSDFTHWFLQALNPIATVISSGDDEPHSHPRSDTLGAIGRYSRSNPRPLIFSTELARSSKDSNQKPWELRSAISKKVEEIVETTDEAKRKEMMKDLKDDLEVDIRRSVAVYGAITVVTDGEKAMIYQKLERKGSHGEYDIYCLEPGGKDKKGPLIYQSKHH